LVTLLPVGASAQTGPATTQSPARAAIYSESQCNLAAIMIWLEGNAQEMTATSTASRLRTTSAGSTPTPAEQARLAQLETQKTGGTRLKIIGLRMMDALGSYVRGSAPVANMAANGALIPVVQVCLVQYTAQIEGAQSQRWIDFQTATDGEKSAINAASIKTVGAEVHMSVLTTPPMNTPLMSLGQYRSTLTHWAFTCTGQRTASARTMYFLRPGTDDLLAVSDGSAEDPVAITRPTSPIANLARVACGETRLRPEAQSFPNLLAIVRNQEAATSTSSTPSPAPKR
jgi:hypothetical protein